MKIIIYFFSCLLFSLPHLANAQIFGKSPEEKCFDAQMKIWDSTPITKVKGYRYKSIVGYLGNVPYNKDIYYFQYGQETLDAKAHYEADAWARCMKR